MTAVPLDGDRLDAIEAQTILTAKLMGREDRITRETFALVAALRASWAEVERLRGERRDLTSRLGFGDGVTEPQGGNDDIVRWYDQISDDAREWWESQAWRADCHEAGHPDDEDCYEHDPSLRLYRAESERDEARAALAAAERKLAERNDSAEQWEGVALAAIKLHCNAANVVDRVRELAEQWAGGDEVAEWNPLDELNAALAASRTGAADKENDR